MRKTERITIYTVLTVIGMVNVVLLLSQTGTPAFAAPLMNLLTDLGPAEAVTLVQDDDAEAGIVLHNEDGRLAWSESVHDRAYSTGFVYIGRILRQLLEAERFQEQRDALVDDLNTQDEDYRTQLDALWARLKEMEPEAAETQQLNQQGQELYEQYMQFRQDAVTRRGQLDAEHLEQAYREMVDAVEIVSDRKHIDIVSRFIPTGESFDATNPEQAMLAIRLRNALRYPDDLDITDDVLEELALNVEED